MSTTQLGTDQKRTPRKREHTILALSLLFVLFSLIILYKVPYNADDAINCITGGVIKYEGISVWDLTLRLLKIWIDSGRFYPLAFYSYSLFTVLPTLFAYRTFLVILNLLVISSFGWLIYKLSRSVQTASFAILIVPAFIQFRVYNDPVLAFHGMLQFVMLYLIWAILLQLYAIEKGKVLPLIFSSLLYACCILTYEISYAFILIFILTAIIFGKGKQRVLAAIPHFVVTGIIILYTFYLRSRALGAYSGTSFSLDLAKIVKTYFKQLSAGFPLSYWLLTKPPYLLYTITGIMGKITARDIFLTVMLFVILLGCFWLLPRKARAPGLFLYGSLLCLLPPAILSLSERYQGEVLFGFGYLPVYVQYFGTVLLAVALIQTILAHVKKEVVFRIVTGILSLCICLVFLINNVNNHIVQSIFDESSSQGIADTAMTKGLLDSINNDSLFLTLSGGRGIEFDPQSFVCLYADVYIKATDLKSLVAAQKEESSQTAGMLYPDNLYVFEASGTQACGFAAVGKVDSIVYDPAAMTIIHVNVKEMRIYLCNDGSGMLQLVHLNDAGTTVAAALPVSNIFANPEADLNQITLPASSDTGMGMKAVRTTPIQQIGRVQQIFALNQEKSCMLTIQAESGIIQFDTVGITVPK